MSKKQQKLANLLRSKGLEFEEEVRDLPGTPDIFFRNKKLAIFFHGCYWHNHGCGNEVVNPITASQRAARSLTDQQQQKELLEQGYKYLVVWECDFDNDPDTQVLKVINRLHFS